MLIPFSELPAGALYIVPNEEKSKIRTKGGPFSGCAMRRNHDLAPPFSLHLRIDPNDRIQDPSLMVLQVHV
jgi:hypothetical protein